MGPGVVCAHRNATPSAALNIENEAVITGGPGGFDLIHRSKKLARCRILQAEPAALVQISIRRTSRLINTAQNTGRQAQEHAWIARPLDPHMNRVVSEISRRQKPIGADLSLQAQVPLVN